MKQVLIFGGSGFIGRHLINELITEYQITVLSRNPEKNKNVLPKSINLVRIDLNQPENLIPVFEKADVIINLAGASIGSGRWTKDLKHKVSVSRQKVNQLIITAFEKAGKKPGLIIQASAIGIYGVKIADDEITESFRVTDEGLLAETASLQENSFRQLENKTRVVFIRSGIILDKKEGALPRLILPFQLFIGGKLGSGRQWLPWIHIKDEVRAIRFIIENNNVTGPVNLTAPEPVRQLDFAKTLAGTIHRPSWLSAPSFGLRLLLGKERADSLLLTGLKIIPKKLKDFGFEFQFNTIKVALKNFYN